MVNEGWWQINKNNELIQKIESGLTYLREMREILLRADRHLIEQIEEYDMNNELDQEQNERLRHLCLGAELEDFRLINLEVEIIEALFD